MKNIETLVQNVKKYNDAIVQIDFKSKKNTVSYVTIKDKPRVLKWFVPGLKNNMKNEYNILLEASLKLNIPQPIDLDEDNFVISMNYIMGENLCDIVNDEKTSFSEKERLMILLANWFADFHSFFKKDTSYRIRGDANLRNFIMTDKLWGVDFEESRNGRPIEDISCMCASILSTNPMFTDEKYTLCKKFLETYSKQVSWNLPKVNDEIAYALLERIQYRPDQEEILREKSKRVRKKGL